MESIVTQLRISVHPKSHHLSEHARLLCAVPVVLSTWPRTLQLGSAMSQLCQTLLLPVSVFTPSVAHSLKQNALASDTGPICLFYCLRVTPYTVCEKF